MTSYRTPLGRARGLGSAKHGVGHWISERVSSVALVFLCLWALWSGLVLARTDYVGATDWAHAPVNAVMLVLLLAVGFWHMHAGMRVIVEDYVYGHLTKTAALLANYFLCLLVGALAIISILKVALGGA